MHAFDGLIQRAASGLTALARLAGRNQRLLAQLRGLLLGGDHLLGAADHLFGGPQLRLHPARQLPHRKRYLSGRQRIMTGSARQIAGQQSNVAVTGLNARNQATPARQTRQPDHQQRQRCDYVERQPGHAHGRQQQAQRNTLHRRHPPLRRSARSIGQRQPGCHG